MNRTFTLGIMIGLLTLTFGAAPALAGKSCHERLGDGVVLSCGGTAEEHESYGFGLVMLPGTPGNFTAEIPNAGIAALDGTRYRCSCDDKGQRRKPKFNVGGGFTCTSEPVILGGPTVITVFQGTLNGKGTKVTKGRGHLSFDAIVGDVTVESILFTCHDGPQD